jgi:hypothetical protein
MKNKKATALIVLAFVATLSLLSLTPPTHAQTPTAFTPNDQFTIPERNGIIRFGFSGNYSSATIENGSWLFKNLQMEHPQSLLGFDLNGSRGVSELKFSAEDSNVTIWACLSFYYTLPVYSIVYTAEGVGSQSINLGFNSTESDVTEWSVIVGDNIFLAEGDGWTLTPDGTIIVNGLVGNVTIAHFELGSFEKNVLFYLEHSIAILTGVVLAIVTVAAVAIKIRIKKKHPL